MPGETIPDPTRRAVLARADGACEICGLHGLSLELHHKHYNSEYHETPDDLLALCRDCHQAQHVDPNGDFWRDPEEMDTYWLNAYWLTR